MNKGLLTFTDIFEALGLILRPLCILVLIILPFIGTRVWFWGFMDFPALSGHGYDWMYWVGIAPLFLFSLHLILRFAIIPILSLIWKFVGKHKGEI
jgi:hypothetical protein